MIIEKIKELKPSGLIAVLIGLFMPLFPKLLPVLLVLLILSLFLDYKSIKLHAAFKTMTWLFALTYLFYVFGMLSSSHIRDGLFILEVKFSFLVIPLFFLFHGPFHVKILRKILFAFVAGCFINTLLCLNKGLGCYLEHGWPECFFTSRVAYGFHTTYLSLYYCLAILFIVYYLINFFSRLDTFRIGILIFLLAYFSGFTMLLSSKGGFIALLTVWMVAVFYFLYKKGGRKTAGYVFLGMIFLGTVFYFTTDVIRMRVKSAIADFKLSKEELYEKHRESTESTVVRLMIWDVAATEIRKNPMGLGTGDAQHVLMQRYEEKGMTGAYGKRLNCHSQFYETALAIGIHGLSILIIFLLYILYVAVLKRNFLLLWIAVIVILNLFFESMFETQAGVIFFVFFTGLLLTSVPDVIPLQQDEK